MINTRKVLKGEHYVISSATHNEKVSPRRCCKCHHQLHLAPDSERVVPGRRADAQSALGHCQPRDSVLVPLKISCIIRTEKCAIWVLSTK